MSSPVTVDIFVEDRAHEASDAAPSPRSVVR